MPKVFAERMSELSRLEKCAKKSEMFSEILIKIYHKNFSFKTEKKTQNFFSEVSK